MRYEEFPPPEPLRATIASLWRFDVDEDDPAQFEHTIPPDGCVNLAVAYSAQTIERVVVVGPRVSALRVPVRRGIGYMGLRARPGAGSLVIGKSPAALRELVVPLQGVSPGRAETLFARLAFAPSPDRVLAGVVDAATEWLKTPPSVDPVVGEMIGRLVAAHGQIRVRGLAEGTGLGYRQALRRFVVAVGLSPKEFARLLRVRHACLASLERRTQTWATVSADTGFSDQAHLNREFSDIFGWPPGLVREYLRRIEHVGVSA